MTPHAGLVHLKEYDIKDSNIELIGSTIDHKVKYASAASEPAWNNGSIGTQPGLFVWRIEDFAVVPWPTVERLGLVLFDGDSYIVLQSTSVKTATDGDKTKLVHDIFFWLGTHTSQDEAGVAAYKTVELDEFLHGTASQHRELQAAMSDAFLALFPRLTIRSGGVRSGFRHVDREADSAQEEGVRAVLRVFKPAQGPTVVVHEVPPTWRSLDDGDVFIVDVGAKIWVWQGSCCSPMEKAKAAQVVHDLKLVKHVDEEVISQAESRSRVVVQLLGGDVDVGSIQNRFSAPRPGVTATKKTRAKRLFRLSDASGEIEFRLVREGGAISGRDLDKDDVFLLDDGGTSIWVWEGSRASKAERALWLKVAQTYVRQLARDEQGDDCYHTPIAKVREGYEGTAFSKAIEAS